MAILTDTKARTISTTRSILSDGTVKGLRLHPSSRKGHGYWFLRYTSPVDGEKRTISFGKYPETSIAEARELGGEARKAISRGIDPKVERETAQAVMEHIKSIPTFEDAAREFIRQKQGGWSNPKHAAQWTSTLETYVFPHIGSRKVDSLEVDDFRKVLAPIWLEKAETARRVKQRCSKIIQWCWAQKFVQNNVLNVVGELLPDAKAARTPVHFPAMPWQNVPEFVASVLRDGTLGTCRALMEMLILTATRSGEARKMTWDQIDLDKCVWTIPAKNTKKRRVHEVPLSPRCLEILQFQKAWFKQMFGKEAQGSDLVFPSNRGKIFSDMTLSKFLKDHNVQSDTPPRNAVPHGFRTSFRGWATVNEYPEHIIEMCLAHVEGNKSIAAYKRELLLEKRRDIMCSYANYVASFAS